MVCMIQTHPIARLRDHLGLSRAELGDSLGISRQSVFYVERGDYEFSRQNIIALFDIYRRDLEELKISFEDMARGLEG